MTQWLVNNWVLIVIAVCAVAYLAIQLKDFLGLPSNEQINKVKEWLLYAVTEAEKELGGGTGKLKLRLVYDKFLTKFPALVSIVPFETFSSWVDEVLVSMRSLINTNTSVEKYVEDSKE